MRDAQALVKELSKHFTVHILECPAHDPSACLESLRSAEQLRDILLDAIPPDGVKALPKHVRAWLGEDNDYDPDVGKNPDLEDRLMEKFQAEHGEDEF